MPGMHVKLWDVARQVRKISRSAEKGRFNEVRIEHGKMIPKIREISAQIANNRKLPNSLMEIGRLADVLGYLARGGNEITTWSVSHQRKLHDLSFCYKHPQLEDLDASYTGISSDADVLPLKALKTLKFLRVDHTNMQSIRVLKEIKTLDILGVHKGQFSAAQIKDLKKAVPKCRVIVMKDLNVKEDKDPGLFNDLKALSIGLTDYYQFIYNGDVELAGKKGPAQKISQRTMIMPGDEDFIEDPGSFNPDPD